MGGNRDVERGGQGQEFKEPLMGYHRNNSATDADSSDKDESIWVVLLSTFVAVCGSFEFGTCVRTYFYIMILHERKRHRPKYYLIKRFMMRVLNIIREKLLIQPNAST